MILIHSLFTSDELSSLLTQDEVIRAKQRIDGQLSGSVYFSLELPVELHSKLSHALGRELSVKRIPMRWIKGDTEPHVDVGSQSFEQTYLAYLTASSGSLVFGDETYPITQGTVYSFQQGCVHGTVGTGSEPRLLLGPMSEQGFAVGASPSLIFPGETTVYLQQIEGYTAFSTDQQDWYIFSWPATLSNSDTSLGFVTVEWTTDMTIDSPNMYFICATSHIQFGKESLRNDGTRPVITVTATDYTGLIQNGMGPQQGTPGLNPSQLNGYSDIRVYNLFIDGTGGTLKAGETFDEGAGWFTHNYFGKGAQRNIIINCCSAGAIPNFCGGIVGRNSGEEGDDTSSAGLLLLGCSSTGSISTQGGGIAGAYIGYNGGNTILSGCYTTGAISGNGAGGIVGANTVSATIQDCYSTGQISGNNAGGIIGANAGRNAVVLQNCYSTGNISGSNAGGLCGSMVTANSTDLFITITNGYTTGSVTGPQSGGIIGLLLESSGSINKYIINVYTTGMVSGTGYIYGNSASINTLQYSEAGSGGSPGSWNTAHANTVLNPVPSSEPGIGEIWISTGVQQPYELRNMGYTPYSAQNIFETASNIPFLNRIYPYNSILTGREPNKDMADDTYTREFTPFDFQGTFFSDMSDFIDGNILAGDKSEENRLIASYWHDLGNDIFDNWGFFYLYDVSTGRYYFPLLTPQNQDDGIITTQIFLAFGRTFTLRHGWAAQGIFMMDWSVADSLPFRFGAYGNMGSDGHEETEYRTQPYTIEGSPRTLYYHRDAQSGSTSEILYTYFIPKEPTEATSTPYSVVYDGTDMSMRTNALTVGVTIYFAKTYNVKKWVISEITSSQIVPIIVSFPSGGSTLAALIPNRNYQLLMVEGGDAASYNTFTINPVTGVISTTSATVPGAYTLYLRNTGSYHITEFDLNVTEADVVSTGCCDRVLDVKGLDYRTQAEVISGNIILSRFSERRGPLSSLDIIRMKQAMAQKR